MVEVRDRASLVQIRFGVFGPADQPAMRHLDCHRPAQLVVLGQIHQAEPTLAQHAFDPIPTDSIGELSGGLVTSNGRSLPGRPFRGRIVVRRYFLRIAVAHA